MLLSIIQFELKYRFRRPATFLYLFIVFLVGFLAFSTDDFASFGSGGQVKTNATFAVYNLMGLLSIIPMIFISSAVMGVPVVRDYEHRMESILFSTNISKFNYIIGRFIGSYLIILFISLGAVIGPILASVMPWVDHDKFQAFSWALYVKPFLFFQTTIIVPCIIYFAVGVMGKRMLVVYIQGIVFVGIIIITQTLLTDTQNLKRAALMDVSGLYAFTEATRYWTIAEKNTSFLSLTSGVLLWNRVIWMGIALFIAAIAYLRFSFSIIGGKRQAKKKAIGTPGISSSKAVIPLIHIHDNAAINWQRFFSSLKLYTRQVIKSLPFIGIVAFALVIFIINAQYADKFYGTGNWPLTHIMLDGMRTFSIYMYAIIVFYSGELVWKEKDIQFDQIYGSTPTPAVITQLAKIVSLTWVLLLLHLGLILVAMIMQAAKGYYNFEIPVYLQYVGATILNLFIVTCVAFFFQLVVKNKFVGFALTVSFLVFDFAKDQFGFRHPLVSFNSGAIGQYSDMNHFAADSLNFFWMKSYWLGFALILFIIGILLNSQNGEGRWKERFKTSRAKFNAPMKAFVALAILLFVGAGTVGFINYNWVNKYRTRKEGEERQVQYENSLKKFEREIQPEVVETNLKVELYPDKARYEVSGFYWLKNVETKPLDKIYIQLPSSSRVSCPALSFDKKFTKEKEYADFKFTIYSLQQPLQPGDSVKMNFTTLYQQKGFGNTDANFVENGTFFDNSALFPTIGYSRGNELSDMDKRKKYKLPKKDEKPDLIDSSYWHYNLLGVRKRMRFEIVIGTNGNQTAIAPGYLQKKWTENGRSYFHYKMDSPIFNFYNIVSARYAVKKDTANGVNLEVYYHPSHTYNVDLFLKAMREVIKYNNDNFGPYQYRQLRILEFPRYRNFAQSFPNTVPFSEILGFIMKKNKEDDLDMGYYITAHEIGHQWWGHQVVESPNKGGQMYSESLAQYSALMALKKYLSDAQIKKYLKYELDNYLGSRSAEKKKENPLSAEDGQGYIYYQKGTLVYYTLQDYLGETKVNEVLRRLLKEWAFREDRYLTSDVLVSYFKQAAPDSLQYLVEDLFNKITVYDNRALKPTYKKIAYDDYEVTIPVSSIKYYADGHGVETKATINDILPIGVMGRDKNGKDSLVAYKKVRIVSEKQTCILHVKSMPSKAGIDPLNMFVDRDTNDNLEDVTEVEKK